MRAWQYDLAKYNLAVKWEFQFDIPLTDYSATTSVQRFIANTCLAAQQTNV
jgi:hypothetical protein